MMRNEQSTTGNISALVELFFDYNITELRSNQKNSTIISGSLEKQTVPQDWNVPTYGHLFQSWMEMVIYGGALVSRSLLKINKYMYGMYWLPLVHESSRLDSGVTLQTGLPLSLWEYWNFFSFFFFLHVLMSDIVKIMKQVCVAYLQHSTQCRLQCYSVCLIEMHIWQ